MDKLIIRGGRQLDLDRVTSIIHFAVERTRPDLTVLLDVPIEVSEARRLARSAKERQGTPVRDRIEEADRAFFERVQTGFQAIAAAEPGRVRIVNATDTVPIVENRVWDLVSPLIDQA